MSGWLAHWPGWLQAGFRGGVAGSGGAVAWWLRVPAPRLAFGSGVLIPALSFELMDEAFHRGGLDSALGSSAARPYTPA